MVLVSEVVSKRSLVITFPDGYMPTNAILHGVFDMSESNSDVGMQYLRTPEAAKLLGLSPRTLEKHRTYGTGPQYLKLGGRVVYRINDLHAWAAQGTRKSTSDPGVGFVPAAKRYLTL